MTNQRKSDVVVSNGIKDTNLKANHNARMLLTFISPVVSNGIKDTNLKANHNKKMKTSITRLVVSNGIKDTNLKANHNLFTNSKEISKLFPMVSKILI